MLKTYFVLRFFLCIIVFLDFFESDYFRTNRMSATDALMVRAPRDSGLASFLRLFNRDPSAIKLVTLEHLLIKYISFFSAYEIPPTPR